MSRGRNRTGCLIHHGFEGYLGEQWVSTSRRAGEDFRIRCIRHIWDSDLREDIE
jgi:hypothetical protein